MPDTIEQKPIPSAEQTPRKESNTPKQPTELNGLVRGLFIFFLVTSAINCLTKFVTNLVHGNTSLGILMFVLEVACCIFLFMMLKHKGWAVLALFGVLLLQIPLNLSLGNPDMQTVYISTFLRIIVFSILLTIPKNGVMGWQVLFDKKDVDNDVAKEEGASPKTAIDSVNCTVNEDEDTTIERGICRQQDRTSMKRGHLIALEWITYFIAFLTYVFIGNSSGSLGIDGIGAYMGYVVGGTLLIIVVAGAIMGIRSIWNKKDLYGYFMTAVWVLAIIGLYAEIHWRNTTNDSAISTALLFPMFFGGLIWSIIRYRSCLVKISFPDGADSSVFSKLNTVGKKRIIPHWGIVFIVGFITGILLGIVATIPPKAPKYFYMGNINGRYILHIDRKCTDGLFFFKAENVYGQYFPEEAFCAKCISPRRLKVIMQQGEEYREARRKSSE